MTKLEYRPLSPILGVEVVGFDPSGDVDDDTLLELSRAFNKHAVLVFRDIEITPRMQRKVAEVLYANGDLAKVPKEVSDSYSLVSNREDDGGAAYGRLLFHIDMMWAHNADQVPTLYALEVEQPSVPTLFCSSTHAWNTLPDELKARVSGLQGRHSAGRQGRGKSPYEAELLQPTWETAHEQICPIALKHPRTGETMLYVGEQHTREIVGLSPEESDALLDELIAHLYRPELVLEHHWRKGDFVIWDNQAAHHGRPYLKGDGPARSLRKVHAPANLMDGYGKGATYEEVV